MGVFGITTFSSLFAYIWLWYVLMDQKVSIVEAWLTFFFFILLLVTSFAADKYTTLQRAKQNPNQKEDDIPVIDFTAKEIYKELVLEQSGNSP